MARAQASRKRPAATAPAVPQAPVEHRSEHFLLRTDLTTDEAAELLERLEYMLALISAYWQQPPVGAIECNVVRQPHLWPAGLLGDADRALVEAGGGITHSLTVIEGRKRNTTAVVFASADHGTPQHEAVHAFCAQAFGTTGPVWYSEGMAEMGQYWRKGDRGVNCDASVVTYIRGARRRTMLEIVNGRQITGDSWREYSWRWALCHLLENNPNYQTRFRALGQGLLHGEEVAFEEIFGPVADQISFEYDFFLGHFDRGYRVDLCAWDWRKKFRALTSGQARKVEVQAARGWQASGCTLEAGERYEYDVAGKCRLNGDGPEVDADGGEEHAGRLVGVLMKNQELGKPFPLGKSGTLTAPASGNLYLRCDDAWSALADNKGKFTARIKPVRGDAATTAEAPAPEERE